MRNTLFIAVSVALIAFACVASASEIASYPETQTIDQVKASLPQPAVMPDEGHQKIWVTASGREMNLSSVSTQFAESDSKLPLLK